MVGFIFVSSLLSLAFIWAVYALARSNYWGTAGACVMAAIATLPFLMCMTPALALHSALTFVLLLLAVPFRPGPRAVAGLSIAAMLVAYGAMFWSGYTAMRDLARLREEHPLVSVADRLDYESRPQIAARPAPENLPHPELSAAVSTRLAMAERNREHGYRSHSLRLLHERTTDSFAMARGFGPMRMATASREGIELPEPAASIPIPPEPEPLYEMPQPSADSPAADETEPRPEPAPIALPPLASIHDAGSADFLDPDRIGYVQDREHVAGFQSHRFTKFPTDPAPWEQPARKPPAESWQVVRLDLVSLLKHEEPVAYVSENLPRMDELRDAPTRALDEFERRALEQLRSAEDVVIDERPDRIRMVGSLRAGHDCRKCHAVERGDLLGALTYELVPGRAIRKQRMPEAPIQ